MKIHLFGTSRAGITTLGTALGVPYFDGDDYFWGPSDVPFSVRRPWAAGYDAPCDGSRTLANRTAWLGRFARPVLALHGDLTVAAQCQH